MKNDGKRAAFWLFYCLAVTVLCVVFVIRSGIFSELRGNKPGEAGSLEASAAMGSETADEEVKPEEKGNKTRDRSKEYNGEENTLETELKALEEENRILNDEYKERIKKLDEYREKTEETGKKNAGFLTYYVQNFNAQYDSQAVSDLENQNQINYAVGELAKTKLVKYAMPELAFFGLMGSMINSNNDVRYKYMVNINNYYESSFEDITKKTREGIEKLGARIDAWKELTDDNAPRAEKAENLILLEHLPENEGIDSVDKELREAEEDLYIYSVQLALVRDIYRIILVESSEKNVYLNNLDEQIKEINGLFNKDTVAGRVSGERLGEYLVPLIDYYVWLINEDGALYWEAIGLDYRSRQLGSMHYRYDGRQTTDGKMYLARICECKYNGNLIPNPSEDIYFVGGSRPVYINGHYLYDGKLLTEDGSNAGDLYDYADSLVSRMFPRG